MNVTLNTYTHVNYEDAVAECKRLRITKKISNGANYEIGRED